MKKKEPRPGKISGPAGALVAFGIILSLLSITFNLRTVIPSLLTAFWVELSYAQETRNDGAATKAFLKASQVFLNPRCVNCHSAGDGPLQLDKGVPHAMNIKRGPEGFGKGGVHCNTCHQNENQPGTNMPPGAPGWKLPPENMPMVFEKKSPHDLCLQLKNPAQNGNMTLKEVVEHVRTAPLVLWAWNPGEGRTPVSMPHDEFVGYVSDWVKNGGACPE
jgi:hypothetical protein